MWLAGSSLALVDIWYTFRDKLCFLRLHNALFDYGKRLAVAEAKAVLV